VVVADALFDAAARCNGRLPEALTGHARSAVHGADDAPMPYPGACSPQAWSASSVVLALQATLGLYPFAPAHVLALVHPRLPHGVNDLVLHDVVVAGARATLRFERTHD